MFGVPSARPSASRSAPAAAPVHKLVPYPKAECLKEKVQSRRREDEVRAEEQDRRPRMRRLPLRDLPREVDDAHQTATPVFDQILVYKNTFTWTVPDDDRPGPGAADAQASPPSTRAADAPVPGSTSAASASRRGESPDFILPVCADKIKNPATSSGSRTLHLKPAGAPDRPPSSSASLPGWFSTTATSMRRTTTPATTGSSHEQEVPHDSEDERGGGPARRATVHLRRHLPVRLRRQYADERGIRTRQAQREERQTPRAAGDCRRRRREPDPVAPSARRASFST